MISSFRRKGPCRSPYWSCFVGGVLFSDPWGPENTSPSQKNTLLVVEGLRERGCLEECHKAELIAGCVELLKPCLV